MFLINWNFLKTLATNFMNLVAFTHEIYIYLAWIITNYHGSILLSKEKLKPLPTPNKRPTAKERKRGRKIFLTTLLMPKASPSYKDQFPFQAFLLIPSRSLTKWISSSLILRRKCLCDEEKERFHVREKGKVREWVLRDFSI
jgi:hypothetical protein